MSEGHWTRLSKERIAEVHRRLPEDATFKERKAALKDAYPFGERAYWPYKAWCKARKAYLAKYDPKTPPPPLVRDMLADRDDIIFPWAGESAA